MVRVVSRIDVLGCLPCILIAEDILQFRAFMTNMYSHFLNLLICLIIHFFLLLPVFLLSVTSSV